MAGKEPNILSVSQLSYLIKDAMEASFSTVWVSGELSDIARPRSGHIYLTLKDDDAQIRGVMWRSAAAKLPFELEDGQQVICQGGIDVYPPRGNYQLVIRKIEPAGLGALQLALQQLTAKLAKEGLFDPELKKPLPDFPKRVAFVTSPTGAAVRDFLEVARRRWKGCNVLVIPAKVQGQGAEAEIAGGIRAANMLADPPEVLVVGRGGGSMEDLWCFNSEEVVRAIFASEIPVVSAVGHEIDVTLADAVADVRALTPSEAAELVVPNVEELLTTLGQVRRRMTRSLFAKVENAKIHLDALAERRFFRKPFDWIRDYSHELDDLESRATRALQIQHREAKRNVAAIAGRLESLSPLRVLQRGYSLTQADDGSTVKSITDVQPEDTLSIQLHDGRLEVTVKDKIQGERSVG